MAFGSFATGFAETQRSLPQLVLHQNQILLRDLQNTIPEDAKLRLFLANFDLAKVFGFGDVSVCRTTLRDFVAYSSATNQ